MDSREVKSVPSNDGGDRVRPTDLQLSSIDNRSSRFSSGTVYSPVTELSMNLGDLSTDTGISGFSFIKPIEPPRLDDTPKRKFSVVSPTPLKPILQKQLSFDSGSSDPSPDAAQVTAKQKFGTLLKDSNSSERSLKRSECRSSAYARFKGMPLPFCGFGSSPSITCPPESVEDKENSSPAKSLFRDVERIRSSSPLAERKSFFVGADDTNSQDSGVGLDLPSKSEDGFKFPIAPAPRRHRIYSDECANSPLKYSPVKDSPTFKGKLLAASPSPKASSSPSVKSSHQTLSPVKLRRSSLTCSPVDDEGDEGFLDLHDIDNDDQLDLPSGLDKLISAPVLHSKVSVESEDESDSIKLKCAKRLQVQLDDSFEIKDRPKSLRRGLFRSPSDPLGGFHRSKSFAYGASPCFNGSPACSSPMFELRRKKSISPRTNSSKRSEPCVDEEFTPLRQCKRRKSVIDVEAVKKENTPSVESKLRRCHSEAEIKQSLCQADDPSVVGDRSTTYCLPTISGKHPDLKSITCDTMARLLRGEYDHVVEKFIVVDSRYPYEFDGGHIQGAKNIFTKDDLLNTFIKSNEHRDYKCKASSKRQIIIFHCEFSSERGPKMSKFLRSNDRLANKDCYPSLYYPEVYLLHNGYKEFYYNHQTLCEPQTYKPMLHEAHQDDLKKFRAKSKSWAGEQRSRHSFRTGLKF